MKLYLLLILVLTFSFSAFGQNELKDPAFMKISYARKLQVSRLLTDVDSARHIYLDSTDYLKITNSTAQAVKNIRAIVKTLPSGKLKQKLTEGAAAWEQAYLFRYDSPSKKMMSTSKKSEIIKFYKIERIAPEYQSARLFVFAESFLDTAAAIVRVSGPHPLINVY